MATTVENRIGSDAKVLQSYLGGKWQSGAERGAPLVNPCDGTVLAWASSKGLDLKAALNYSRNVGGPELRKLTFAQRAELLGKIADLLATRRDEWYELARKNSGNTKADAAIDVDGSIGTLKYFAKIGTKLGDAHMLCDGSPMRLARDQNFQGLHVGVPLDGVAVHINAFNFPAWGLWEKAAVSLLAGVPVLSKPATSTAWLAQEMVSAVIEAGILPPGSLSILCGSPNDLLDHLRLGDVVAFTGSADTGAGIRQHPRICEQGVRVNIEADSLNAALLGPDAAPGSPSFDFFVREVVREMTSKTGQKCTAIRRALVPAEHAAAATDAIAAGLSKVVVGSPANPTVTMGPVVNMTQRESVEEGIRRLSEQAQVAYSIVSFAPVDASAEQGAFVPPTLLKLGNSVDGEIINELEVFGPVATVVPYRDKEDAFAIARRGGGSLAASVFSSDTAFLAEAAAALGTTHGRLLLVDPAIGDSHTGHGIVLPSLMHGGPGRAGGGEELGGLHGLWFYHQRVAMQISAATISSLAAQAADPSAEEDLRPQQQRGEVLVDGKRLETLWIGPEQEARPTLVMLHEGLGSVALWKHFPERLAANTGCGVLVYSRYGNGRSDMLREKRPVAYMHHEGEVVLPELLEKLNIMRPILLGHSDGGSIALVFAGRYADRPRALILEAPHVFVENLSVASITQAKVRYPTTNMRPKLARYHEHVDATFWGWNDIWLDPQFRSWNIEEYLPSIRCPILCIQGEEDEYGTIAQLKAIKARVPGTEILMLPNCKHSPHRDQAEATLEKMVEFVGAVQGRAEATAAMRGVSE